MLAQNQTFAILLRLAAPTAPLMAAALATGCIVPRRDAQVSGRTLDADSLLPIANVSIECRDQRTVSAQDGTFLLSLPPGVHELHASVGRTSLKRFVGIADTNYNEYWEQQQDVLIPSSPSKPVTWLVSYARNALFESDSAVTKSGLLLADQYGNGGRFVETGREMADFARWDRVNRRIYFSEDFGFFLHDLDTATNQAVACDGLPPKFGPDLICLDDKGERALVGNGPVYFALESLSGSCKAISLPGLDVRSPRMCSFDQHGRAYVTVQDEIPNTIPPSNLTMIDFTQSPLRMVRIESVMGWDLMWPVAVLDGTLLAQRDCDDCTEPDTWRIPLNGDEPSRLSDTAQPLDLVGSRLYFDQDGLRTRDLNTGREAVLFNAAWSADRMTRWD